MIIRVDFYRPSGKWYIGGSVEVGDVKLWHGRDVLLKEIWKNQKILNAAEENRSYYTVVSDDDPEMYAREDYKEFFMAVLQVGTENGEKSPYQRIAELESEREKLLEFTNKAMGGIIVSSDDPQLQYKVGVFNTLKAIKNLIEKGVPSLLLTDTQKYFANK